MWNADPEPHQTDEAMLSHEVHFHRVYAVLRPPPEPEGGSGRMTSGGRYYTLGIRQCKALLALLKYGRSDLKSLVDPVYPNPPKPEPFCTPRLKSTISESIRRLRARGLVQTQIEGKILKAELTAEGKAVACVLRDTMSSPNSMKTAREWKAFEHHIRRARCLDLGEKTLIIRAKWTMDGAKTLEEAARKMESYVEWLRNLKAEGWELEGPVEDDYGFLKRKPVM